PPSGSGSGSRTPSRWSRWRPLTCDPTCPPRPGSDSSRQSCAALWGGTSIALNDETLDRAIEEFAEYAAGDRYQAEERGYKQELIDRLGSALRPGAVDGPNFADGLRSAVQACFQTISNLTYFA